MDVMVSIFCFTYNHEDYIARALESFVTQETTFPYEILIHDDASRDGTVKVIEEYEKAYPDIIKSVRQSINQYTKGVPIDSFLIPEARGKYIAECEGDDFWTDSFKLQKQFDFMEQHPNCSLCMHGAVKVRASDEKEMGVLAASPTSRYFETREIIENDNIFSTNSMFYLTEHIKKAPAFIYKAPVIDYPVTIWLSLKGDVYYLNENMSAYRVLVENSWTDQLMKTPEFINKHFNEMEAWLHKLDAYTNYTYSESISNQILANRFKSYRAQYDLKGAKQDELNAHYNKLGLTGKAKLYIGHYLPVSLKVRNFVRRSISRLNT